MKSKHYETFFHFVNSHDDDVYLNIGQIASILGKEVTMSNGKMFFLTASEADELLNLIGA